MTHNTTLTVAALFAFVFALSFVSPASASVLTNGNFETGDLTGWANTAGATIESGSPLAGLHSATLPGGASPDGGLQQTGLGAFTNATTVSVIFSMSDPADRGFNVFIGEIGSGQINLRVLDLGDDGDGDVQIFNSSTSWETVLTDAVVFDSTIALSLTINTFGGGLDYDLTVNGNTATGLSFSQNGGLTEFDRIRFDNDFGVGAYAIDNVSVSVVPVPSALPAGLLLGITIATRRRNRNSVK